MLIIWKKDTNFLNIISGVHLLLCSIVHVDQKYTWLSIIRKVHADQYSEGYMLINNYKNTYSSIVRKKNRIYEYKN